MEEERDIVNASSSQEQMDFLSWFADEYPDFFIKAEKEYWETQND